MKDVKANHICSKYYHHKTLGKKKKDNQEKFKTRKAKPKLEKKYDKTLNR